MAKRTRLGFLVSVCALVLPACGSGKQAEPGDASVAPPSALTHANALLSLRNESARTGFQRVVRGDGRISRDGAGFVAVFDVKPNVAVRLPSKATEPFELRHGAMGLRVAMLGAKPVEGRIEDDGVVYPEAIDGALLAHVPTPHGTEEFLRYEAPPKERRVSYLLSLEGVAGVRLVDREVLEFLESNGNPLLRTTAPWVIDADGEQRRGALELQGCAFDSSAAVPWGRAVTAPGAQTCTLHVTWTDDGLRYPLLVDPPWTDTGALATKRFQHSASRISGSATSNCTAGCVLVAGGINGRLGTGTVLASGEVYNVATGTWGSAGSSAYARRMHPQVDRGSGNAVLFGGATSNSSTTPTATTAVSQYNTTAGWSVLTAMPAARYGHAAVRAPLPYVTGGYASGGVIPQNTAYRFDYTTWTTLTAMAVPRAEHVMVSHGSGSVIYCNGFLVAGGITTGSTKLGTLQHYGAEVGSGCASVGWHTVTGTMSGLRSNFASSFITGGTLLIGGGVGAIDIVSGTTTMSVTPWGGRTTSSAVNLAAARIASANRVLVTGGENTTSTGAYSSAAIIDGNASTAAAISPMKYARAWHTATELPNGSVLLAGGVSCNSMSCSFPTYEELFQISAKGSGCGVTGDCASGLTCVDGVCCDRTCGNKCEACNEPGSVGTCKTVSGVPRGTRGACPTPNTGVCGYTCNGVDSTQCVAAGVSIECGAATCVAGIATPAAKCDSVGSCGTVTSTSCGKFACNTAATACLTPPCATNADCATGYRCDSTSKDCVPTGAAGSPCMITTDCSSGLTCVDGVCCTSSSCTGGMKCNITPSAGTCKLPYGTACTTTTAINCASGQCVDGLCCDTSCTGQCESCNQVGKEGQCKPVPPGGKPVGTRTACTGTGVCQASCNGTNTVSCGPPPGTTVVCAVAGCTGGAETPTRYCNGTGGCAPAASTTCAPYVCGPTECKEACDTAADCSSSTYFCAPDKTCKSTGADGSRCTSDDECTTKFCIDGVCCKTSTCAAGQRCDATTTGTCALPIAAACTTSTECGSGFCVDGVCCNNACLGQCEACNVGGGVGTCNPIVGAPRTGKPACTGTGACQAQCDGADTTKCGAPPGTSTLCAPEACTGTAYTGISQCNGAGSCVTPAASACTPYVCGTTKCKTTCFASSDCAMGYACRDGLCVTTGALGTVCTDPTQCTSGNCVAGSGGKSVCCTVAMCAAGSVCADESVGDRKGTCVKPRGASCATKDDCASGFCVDGVCCDAACSGQCEACNVAGAEGTCSGVTGAPRGMRAACFDGGSDVCKALACDGSKDRTKCATFKNSVETECTAMKCEGKTETPASRCDGMGECKAGTAKDCGNYVCGDTSCKTSCAAQTDCSPGNNCADGKCVPVTNKCDETGTKSVPLDGTAARDCAPFRCEAGKGTCLEVCSKTDDCVTGAICDGTKCVPAPAAGGHTEDSGGCAVSAPRSTGGTSGALLLIGALGVAARVARRRVR